MLIRLNRTNSSLPLNVACFHRMRLSFFCFLHDLLSLNILITFLSLKALFSYRFLVTYLLSVSIIPLCFVTNSFLVVRLSCQLLIPCHALLSHIHNFLVYPSYLVTQHFLVTQPTVFPLIDFLSLVAFLSLHSLVTLCFLVIPIFLSVTQL